MDQPTEPRTVYVLVEPSFLIPVWYSRSFDGLKRAAAKQKRVIQEITSLEELKAEDRVSAVIIVSTNNDWTRSTIEEARKKDIRPILIGCVPSKFGEDVSGTLYSGKSSVETMLHYFASCYRKRVALIGINPNSSNDAVKCETYLSASRFLDMPATYNDIYYQPADSSNPNEYFFRAIEKYDGVICSNDYVAAHVLDFARENGIKVPEQLYVAGLGDIMLCRYTTPTLTSATRSYAETGEQVFHIWRQLNQNKSVFSIVVTVQCEIKPRGSTANSPLPAPMMFHAPKQPDKNLISHVAEASNAVRALENCLAQCDQLDMNIIKGLNKNIGIEALSHQLFISTATARYRLKKLYAAANVTSKAEFLRLFNKHITNDKIFEDFLDSPSF